jgi:hypothetical protein
MQTNYVFSYIHVYNWFSIADLCLKTIYIQTLYNYTNKMSLTKLKKCILLKSYKDNEFWRKKNIHFTLQKQMNIFFPFTSIALYI